jgi:hypothetical protein
VGFRMSYAFPRGAGAFSDSGDNCLNPQTLIPAARRSQSLAYLSPR